MDTRVLGGFYVAVVHAILLFGSEMWVVTPHIKRVFRELHHRVARHIYGKIPQRRKEGTWEYNPLRFLMRAAGLEEIGTYIPRQKNTVAQYIDRIYPFSIITK